MGDLRIGAGAYSTLGSTLQYNNLCFAENEEALPQGWEPLSVETGLQAHRQRRQHRRWMELYIECGRGADKTSTPYAVSGLHAIAHRDGATIVMDPTVAALLKDAHGFKTKAELGEWLAKNVEVAAGTYWGNGVNTTAMMPMALQGLEPYATWSKASA